MIKMTDTEILRALTKSEAIYATMIDEDEYYIYDIGCGCCSGHVLQGPVAKEIYLRLKELQNE